MADEVHWYKRTADHQVFGLGPLFVTRWHNATSLTLLHDQNAAQVAHAKVHHKLLILAVIDHAGMPKLENVNQEFRDTATRYSIENQHHVHAMGYVIPMDGFVGSIARSVVAGLTMVLRQPFPTKSFKNVDDGVTWLASTRPAGGASINTAEALRVLNELRVS